MKNFAKASALLCLLVVFASRAETTSLINYQGKLKKHGTNMNGQVEAVFRIFTGQTNNTCVYEETNQVDVVDGLYSTLIGGSPSQGNIEEAAKQDDAYLEVEINGKRLKPREKFTPPPFASKSTERWTPPSLADAVRVADSTHIGMALKADGTVVFFEAVGGTVISTPPILDGISNIIDVASSGGYGYALTSAGDVVRIPETRGERAGLVPPPGIEPGSTV